MSAQDQRVSAGLKNNNTGPGKHFPAILADRFSRVPIHRNLVIHDRILTENYEKVFENAIFRRQNSDCRQTPIDNCHHIYKLWLNHVDFKSAGR